MEFIDEQYVKSILMKRDPDSHKGIFGHSLLMAGSKGKIGAAVMTAKACLRTGTGLLTVHVPWRGEQILQTSIPEAMVLLDSNKDFLSELTELEKYAGIGIGPGIGLSTETQMLVKELLMSSHIPLVIDADALNCLSIHPDWLQLVPTNSVLTPHPGEFKRIVGEWESDEEKLFLLQSLASKYKINIVLKGAGTIVASSAGKFFHNKTGNPGLAKGGSGDVLTGMITALIAQGFEPLNAAKIGVYLHGLAADIVVKEASEYSLLASDVIDRISDAFREIDV